MSARIGCPAEPRMRDVLPGHAEFRLLDLAVHITVDREGNFDVLFHDDLTPGAESLTLRSIARDLFKQADQMDDEELGEILSEGGPL